jgi:predicted PurR-regulated permease PerM
MLGLDRRAARYTWTAAVVLLLLFTLYLTRKTLFVFIVAVLFAYLLSPLVDFLDRALPTSRTRTPALVIAYLILIGILILTGIELGTRVVEQGNALMAKLPDIFGKLAPNAPAPTAPQTTTIMGSIATSIQAQLRQHSNDIVTYLPKAGLKAISIASNLIFVVVVPILSFFFLKDSRMMRRQILEFFDDSQKRELVADIAKDVNLLLIQYMRALLILSLATLTFYSIFFALMGVPYPLLLGAFAAMMEFIPVVGPLTAAVVTLLVAGFSGYANILGILAFLGGYRIFQDYVLQPRLMSAGMELHPLLVIFGVFAGGEIAGVPGTFLSVPILALARVLYRRLRRAHEAAEVQTLTP